MAGKRPKGRPEPLASLLRSGFAATGLGERLKDLAIWQRWEQVVGPAIARRAKPLRLSGGVLTVVVGSAPWMQQLSFMKADLLAKLNSSLGEERIREIVLRSGTVNEPYSSEEEVQPAARSLSQEEHDWIAQQVGAVGDHELQCEFRSLMEQHYRSIKEN